MSSRFVKSDELRQIDLGDGDWVKVPARYSYAFVQEFAQAQESNDLKRTAGFLLQMIKEWNLKDGEEVALIDQEHIEALEVDTFRVILEKITETLSVPKVEKSESVKLFEDTDTMKLSSTT